MEYQQDEQKAKVADFYSRVAPDYDHIGPQVFTYFGQRMVELAGVTPGARVLDIATGRGANLFVAAERVGETGQVVGIDIADGMVQETSAAIQRRGLRNATVMRMDAEHLTFAANSFDYTLCNFAIFWFQQQEQALAEFFRVLRPHGTFGVTLSGVGDERWRWYYDLMNGYFQTYSIPLPPLGNVKRNEFDNFQDRMIHAGFEHIRTIPVEADMVYTDAEEWWHAKWMHGERYPLENMPPDMLASFKADVMARISSLKQDDGFHERWRVSCVFGNKPKHNV